MGVDTQTPGCIRQFAVIGPEGNAGQQGRSQQVEIDEAESLAHEPAPFDELQQLCLVHHRNGGQGLEQAQAGASVR